MMVQRETRERAAQMNIMKIAICIVLFMATRADAQWESTGGPNGGNFRLLAATDSAAIAVGGFSGMSETYGSTLFCRSTDFGEHWTQIPNFQIAPDNSLDFPKVLGRMGETLLAIRGSGLWYSTDQGAHWKYKKGIGFGTGSELCSVGSTLFALDKHPDFTGNNPAQHNRLYRSLDTGRTWQALRPADSTGFGDMYDLVWSNAGLCFRSVYSTGSGIYRSTDLGNTWGSLSLNLTGDSLTALTSNPTWLFAGTTAGVLRSSDGIAWSNASTGLPPDRVIDRLYSAGSTVFAALLPSGSAQYLSTDSGETWSKIDRHWGRLFAVAANARCTFAATAEGIFRSDDGGRSWAGADRGWDNSGTFNFVKPSGSTIFCGSDLGLFTYAPAGNSWTRIGHRGLPKPGAWLGAIQGEIMFASQVYYWQLHVAPFGGGIYRSSDSGQSWTLLNADIRLGQMEFCGKRLYVGSRFGISWPMNQLGYSDDGGEHWSSVDLGERKFTKMFSVDTMLFLDVQGLGLHRRSENIPELVSFTTGIEGFYVRNIASTIRPGSGRTLFVLTADGLYKRHEDADRWIATGKDWADSANAIAASGSTLFLATRSSVYISQDEGAHWSNTGFPPREVGGGFLVSAGGYVYAFQYSRGVWRLPLSGVSTPVRSAPSGTVRSCALEQNYPNPFNPNSDIRYQISELRMVRLAVYDLLGREVALLVNEAKPAGTYTVRFDAIGLSSGMYFYRMTAGSFVQTRTMVIVK
jgi:photosystem II stability/assembly factor-like uncharacterized protein